MGYIKTFLLCLFTLFENKDLMWDLGFGIFPCGSELIYISNELVGAQVGTKVFISVFKILSSISSSSNIVGVTKIIFIHYLYSIYLLLLVIMPLLF